MKVEDGDEASPDAESPSAAKAIPVRSSLDQFMLKWAKADSLGEEMPRVDVTTEVWDLCMDALAAGPHAGLDEVYKLTGTLISSVALLESAIDPLITFLVNPVAQTRVLPTIRRLGAREKFELLLSLTPADWDDGARLVHGLRDVSEYRNQFAHGFLSNWQLTAEGEFIEGPHATRTDRKTGRSTKEPINIVEIDNKIKLCEVLHDGLIGATMWAVQFDGSVPSRASIPFVLRITGLRPKTLEATTHFFGNYETQGQADLFFSPDLSRLSS